MQFYRPELLYGLFALVIPIVVHLFQLRRFKQEPFTNVALLQKIIVNSRKSSNLKKWLSLIARLLIITFLVIAFSQPYLLQNNSFIHKKEFAFFLDNSYSMSLKKNNLSLLNTIKKELLDYLPNEGIFHLATHDDRFTNLKVKDLKSILYNLEYSTNQLDYKAILNKTKNLFNKNTTANKEILFLSDFQKFEDSIPSDTTSINRINFVKYTANQSVNFSIDTIFVEKNAETKTLHLNLLASEKTNQNIPVSIFNGDKLLGKFTVDFKNEKHKTQSFDFEEEEITKGRIAIEDDALEYDNLMYFTVLKPNPINVLIVSEKPTKYLDKIFNKDIFSCRQVLLNGLEYADLSDTDVLILNELVEIPKSLLLSLENYITTNRVLTIIPNQKIEFSNYNSLFETIRMTPYKFVSNTPIKLTNINFNHPLFNTVFTQKVDNFDYPTFKTSYQSKSKLSALSFSNNMSFLESKNNVFRFNAPIDENSNFKQSPLVVLSFYNIALQTQKKSKLYHVLAEQLQVNLSQKLKQDEVLSLTKGKESFIPRQTSNGQIITLQCIEYPKKAGHYKLINKNKDTLRTFAFNQNRKESSLDYFDLSLYPIVSTYSSFSDYMMEFNEYHTPNKLWRWFIILALIFMIIELLLLRLIK